ncbi:MAG TPA: hypothetical protein VFI84_03115, partial [Candidatus Saccharimonadales bacterium]|nr:hypothetical protein [Candidatus Saccharimonadales bacterium]
GPTIGKSYGFFDGTSGNTVLALINVSYYDPSSGQNIQADNATLNSLTVNGAMSAQSINVGGLANVGSLQVTGSATIGADLMVKGNLTVQGLATVQDITINGHIITGGTTPGIQILPAAGSSNASVSIDGNDTSGTITIVSGDASKAATSTSPAISGPSAGGLATITFKKAYGKTPRILITPADGKSAPMLVYPSGMSATGFTISLTNIPAPNGTYSFNYFIVE